MHACKAVERERKKKREKKKRHTEEARCEDFFLRSFFLAAGDDDSVLWFPLRSIDCSASSASVSGRCSSGW